MVCQIKFDLLDVLPFVSRSVGSSTTLAQNEISQQLFATIYCHEI